MFCPQCGAEHREDPPNCSECGSPLVPQDRQTVFESVNPALVAIAKSILENAGIPYLAANEGSQFAVIPVRIEVQGERAEEARSLLQDLEESPGLSEENDASEE